jgi:BASS family bile acid:Na+ symporter
MFGVALSIKVEHFIQLRHQKKALFTGILSQYVLLPSFTILLILIWAPPPAMALGMILVAACPGGNASNFFSLLARGNVALSVTLTALTSVTAFFMTPTTFIFWSSTIPSLRESVQAIEISFLDLFMNMSGILLLPLLLGMACAHYYPKLTKKISRPTRILSMIILVFFVLIAFWNNISVFVDRIYSVFWLVLLHNGSVMLGAYFFSRLLKNSEPVNRSVAIETAIQNSGLGLVLIFTFFEGNADMALVAAWWAIWHLISGFSFAYLVQRKALPETIL